MIPRPLRLLAFGFFVLLGALSVRADLRLLCEFDGRSLPVVGVDRDRIYCADGDRKIPAPADARWHLAGPLAAHADLAQWTPTYGVRRADLPDAELAATPRPWRAAVTLVHTTESFGAKQESPLLRDWPAGVPDGGIAVFAWVVGGRVVAVQGRAMPSTRRSKYFAPGHTFELSADEIAGHPVVFVWANGAIVAPAPAFKAPADQRALVAALLGDEPGLRAALQAGAKPRATTRHGLPLLSAAAEAGALAAVDVLLAAGARTDDGTRGGQTPLALAVAKGRLAVVERLLVAKAKVDSSDTTLPLHHAIRTGQAALALRLIEAGAPLDTRETTMHTPISLAVEAGLADVVTALLARKVAFDFRNEQIARVLITQATHGHTAMVRLLLARGVKPDAEFGGGHALLAAAKVGDPELVRALLAAGVPAGLPTSAGLTALMGAASAGRVEALRLLLERGAAIDSPTRDGTTALHLAVAGAHAPAVEALLEKGADVALRDARGRAALDFALAAQSRPIAATLAARGARLDLGRPSSAGLLTQAIALDLAPVVRAALADGWSPQTPLPDGWSPLDAALACDAADTAAVLRAAGATPAAKAPPVVSLDALDARPKLQAVRLPVDPRDIDDEFPLAVVEVDVVLDADGRLRFPRLHSTPHAPLGLATLDALGAWRFAPPTRGGQPVAAKFRLPVEFPSSRDRAHDLNDVDTLPVPVKQVAPQYPATLLRQGGVGEVRVRFVVSAEGRTEHIRVVTSPHPDFSTAAAKAVAQWTFKPGRRDNAAVPVRLEVPIIFQQ